MKVKDPSRRSAKMRSVRNAGGHPVSRAEQQMRANLIEVLLLKHRQQERVCAIMSAGITLPDGVTRIRVSRTRPCAYVKRIQERWLVESEAARPQLKAEHRRAVLVDIDSARASGKWAAVIAGHKHLAEVDGLLAPQMHEVSHGLQDGVLAMFAGWSDDEKVRYARTGLRPGEVDATEDDPFAPARVRSIGSDGKANGKSNGDGGNGI